MTDYTKLEKADDVFAILKEFYNVENQGWDLTNLHAFIISFARNSQANNEDNAKKYGNIVKNLVKDIMMKDIIIIPDDESRTEQYVLNTILTNNTLFSMFNKLFFLVTKFENKVESKQQ